MYYLACESEPVNGECLQPSWVQSVSDAITYADFLLLLPAISAMLLFAYGVKLLVRMITNTR